MKGCLVTVGLIVGLTYAFGGPCVFIGGKGAVSSFPDVGVMFLFGILFLAGLGFVFGLPAMLVENYEKEERKKAAEKALIEMNERQKQ